MKIKTDISEELPNCQRNNPTKQQQEYEGNMRSINITHSHSSDKGNKIFHFRENNPFKKKENRKKILNNLYCSSNRAEMGVGVVE